MDKKKKHIENSYKRIERRETKWKKQTVPTHLKLNCSTVGSFHARKQTFCEFIHSANEMRHFMKAHCFSQGSEERKTHGVT